MTTAANVKTSDSSHWYYTDARPCYELPKKDGIGMKVPTLADARKLNLVPSVTTILQLLEKPALTVWKIEQAVLAVMTTPRQPGEPDDTFIKRVLSTDKVQDEEAAAARDMGTDIHDALELHFLGKEVSAEMLDWIMPVATAVGAHGALVACEKCMVGEGFAGKTDLILDAPDCWWLWDWKSTKKLPEKGAWPEHRLQASAYARAFQMLLKGDDAAKPIRTGNAYISSVEKGKFVVWEHDDWETTYRDGFRPLVWHWQWSKGYAPEMPLAKPLPSQTLTAPRFVGEDKTTEAPRARKIIVTEGMPSAPQPVA